VSHFCSKQCFQAAWPEHKEVHRRFKELVAASQMHECPWRSKFAGHDFTGALRPAPVSAQLRGVTGVGKPDYADDPEGRPFSELAERGRKFNIAKWTKPEDVAAMRRAGEIAREVTDLAARAIRPGVTGDQLDKIVHAACIERGVYPSPLNYSGFPKSVCVGRGRGCACAPCRRLLWPALDHPPTPPLVPCRPRPPHPPPLFCRCVSVNEVICHGIPDARPLVDGDIVNLDVTVYYKGFHSDMNETYYVGSVDAGGRRLVACAYECLRAAIAMCKPGVFYCDLGDTITRIAKEAGFTVVKNYTGHGTGALFHTSPNIPHYAKNKAQGRMEVGHVFTIEPVRWRAGWRAGVAGSAHAPPPSSPPRAQGPHAPPPPAPPPRARAADDQRGRGGRCNVA
jgi:methionyl aminopeptidase